MILLVDVGNTRLKWGAYELGQWREKDAIPTKDVSALASRWQGLNPAWVGISNVAGQGIVKAIEQACPVGTKIYWLRPEAGAHGIRNRYAAPASLGADRYAALIAAHKMGLGHAVVASLGTALTVDALTAAGEFLGGIIAPGYRTMLRSIEQSTQGVHIGPGQWSAFPTNTNDALETGMLSALAGAVEAQRNRLEALVAAEATVLLTGGDAALIKPLLRAPLCSVEDLVLEGLLWIARESGVADA